MHWIVSLRRPQHPSPGQDTRPSGSGHSPDEPQSIWGCPLDQESIQQHLTSATHIPHPLSTQMCPCLHCCFPGPHLLILSDADLPLFCSWDTWRKMPFLTLLYLNLALILKFPYCYPFFKDILSPPSNSSHSKQGSSTPPVCLLKSFSLL